MLFFLSINIIAIFHSYKFTHFSEKSNIRTNDPKELSSGEKIITLITGVNNPKPVNKAFPSREYQTIKLQSNKEIECWNIPIENSIGTIVLFHGFSGEKSVMLDKSDFFNALGYNTFLVDFMGSGGSEGNQTTIGYYESEQVKTAFNYLKERGDEKIILYGTSMGAAAIMKSVYDYNIQPKGIILEYPFGYMYKTVCARFKMMNVPCFPMAGLLVFWGGVQNGFPAFKHNPVNYAKEINCPTLLLYGEDDERVSREETDEIFSNLNGEKYLKIYKNVGHDNFLKLNKEEWSNDIIEYISILN